jgi:hypothetical protein
MTVNTTPTSSERFGIMPPDAARPVGRLIMINRISLSPSNSFWWKLADPPLPLGLQCETTTEANDISVGAERLPQSDLRRTDLWVVARNCRRSQQRRAARALARTFADRYG